MTLFIILGGVGLALLLISLVFGDFLDFDGGGLISIPGIAIGLVVFGASGAITTTSGLDPLWVYVIATVIGIVAYALAALVVRSLQRSSDGEQRDITGATGLAMSRITQSTGEVSLDAPGEIERRLAFADADIEQGTRIHVIRMFGSRVKVEPYFSAVPPATETGTTR